jgi:hypothetical protein
MARFYGKVGFGQTQDKGNGVYADGVEYRMYYGDVIRNSRMRENDLKVNSDLTVSNSISVVSDAHANEHFSAIRYVEWAGTLWEVTDVEVQSPRLILRLGGMYNGPQGTAAVSP